MEIVNRFTGAVLRRSDLPNVLEAVEEAVRGGARLDGASLDGASLVGAILVGARYTVPQVLLARWGEVSPETCALLMRLDASAIPDGERLMSEWAAGGPCPLSATNGVGRVANFVEARGHWALAKALPPTTLWGLWERLAAEKKVRIR